MNVPHAPVSVIVPVKDEQANIAACLASVAWAAEVWVVDSASSDCTAAIAQQHGARVVQFTPDPHDRSLKKKNWALATLPLAHEWVLLLDADERVPPPLAAEITRIVAGDSAPALAGYYVNRRLMFLGRWIRHAGWYPSWNLRLLRRGRGQFERLGTADVPDAGDVEVHEHILLQGEAGYLANDLLHEDYKSIYHFVDRHNRYSNWEAQVYANLLSAAPASAEGGQLRAHLFGAPVERKRWLKRLWVRLPGRPLLRFVWMYLIRLGCLDGRPGLIFCALMSFHEAVINAKLYERQSAARGDRPAPALKARAE
jgi:glycosyltransferase involved in cell wall biosynthesis